MIRRIWIIFRRASFLKFSDFQGSKITTMFFFEHLAISGQRRPIGHRAVTRLLDRKEPIDSWQGRTDPFVENQKGSAWEIKIVNRPTFPS